MKFFIVTRKEVWDQHILVEAKTFKEAVEKAKEEDGELLNCEYHHTLDADVWNVEEVEKS